MFNYSIYPGEIAEKLYYLSTDQDQADHEETKEQTIADLENAIYYLLATAQNKYNAEHFRTLYKCLETITGTN